MNIFVLNTGRCGSTTFIRACRHIENYTAAHESRLKKIGEQRLDYPPDHIEADNRLCWYLGRLDEKYGDEAFYVHLTRDPVATAASYAKRRDFGIIRAWREGVLLGGEQGQDDRALAQDCIDTMEANIRHFLRNKTRTLSVRLESVRQDFTDFWHAIDARGDLQDALAEWEIKYNASDQ